MRLLVLPLLAAAGSAAAADASGLAASATQMALGLAVVIALLLVTLWVLKRVAAPRGAAAGMKILGAAAVGPREKVVLVEIGETVLVLGVAPGQVTPLHSLATSDLPGPGPAPAAAPSAAFQAQLRQLLERRK